MKTWNIPEPAIRSVVDSVSRRLYASNLMFASSRQISGHRVRAYGDILSFGRALQWHLTVRDSRAPGSRISPFGRRVRAACWCAYRDVMLALFEQYPAARILTGSADYRGRDNFRATFEATGNREIGQGMRYRNACDCKR